MTSIINSYGYHTLNVYLQTMTRYYKDSKVIVFAVIGYNSSEHYRTNCSPLSMAPQQYKNTSN